MKHILQPTVGFSVALMAIIIMMILPAPAWLIDIGLAISFALAILIFTVVLFVGRPLDFSSFPTILLASLMLRLALNISSTKLIIGQGHTGTDAAGNVIKGFSEFVVNGNIFLGMVIFCVLLIVNFVVINKGATRMAEVGARFALDAMPGKQLAIDADMSSGGITQAEASARREREQAETNFFGSLDGVSKFVKGDAVAGLLITALNIVVGLIVGTAMHGMAFGEAFSTYAILTIGDGLVGQIPAVIISVASALLLARGGVSQTIDTEIIGQVTRHPSALISVAFVLVLFALIPGLPFVPFVAAALGVGWMAFAALRRARRDAQAQQAAPTPEAAPAASIGDVLDLDEIHVEFAPDLVPLMLDGAAGIDVRITNMRNFIAREFGMIVPEIRLTDSAALAAGEYAIQIHGVEVARGALRPQKALALLPDDAPAPPDAVREPVFGAPARWIAEDEREDMSLTGCTIVEPGEVMATHLLETLKKNLYRLLTMKSLRRLLDELMRLSDPARAASNTRMIEYFIPDKIPTDYLLPVLKLLLQERVSIRNMDVILETVMQSRQAGQSPELAAEHVRQSLGFQISARYCDRDGALPIVQISNDWEDVFRAHELKSDQGAPLVALPPDRYNDLTNRIAEKLRDLRAAVPPVLITSAQRRRFIKTVVTAAGLDTPVMSYEELSIETQPRVIGVIDA